MRCPMSKKRGTHVKKNAPSLRAEQAAMKKLRPPVQPPPPPAVNFYGIAVTVGSEGGEVLHERAAEVEWETLTSGGEILPVEVRGLCVRLKWLTENDPNCLGIAAPQVGAGVRVFTVQNAEGKADCWINPVLRPKDDAVRLGEWEGCFSLPDERVYVERWSAVVVSGMNEHGDEVEVSYAGRVARAAQHEMDHIDGVLITAHGKPEPVRGDVIATEKETGVVAAAELRRELAKRG